MNYDTFLKLNAELKKYINEHDSIMCSPIKIRQHLLPQISWEEARQVTQNYKRYLKGRYSLDRLVILIILFKYGMNETFENWIGAVTKPKYMTLKFSHRCSIAYTVKALEEFMLDYTLDT
jgi:hypothetical protein